MTVAHPREEWGQHSKPLPSHLVWLCSLASTTWENDVFLSGMFPAQGNSLLASSHDGVLSSGLVFFFVLAVRQLRNLRAGFKMSSFILGSDFLGGGFRALYFCQWNDRDRAACGFSLQSLSRLQCAGHAGADCCLERRSGLARGRNKDVALLQMQISNLVPQAHSWVGASGLHLGLDAPGGGSIMKL